MSESRERALGPVQVAILDIILTKPTTAYGLGIAAELSMRLGYVISDGQVFTAIPRLLKHGLICETRRPQSSSRGRPRKFYALTEAGTLALISAAKFIPTAQAVYSDEQIKAGTPYIELMGC